LVGNVPPSPLPEPGTSSTDRSRPHWPRWRLTNPSRASTDHERLSHRASASDTRSRLGLPDARPVCLGYSLKAPGPHAAHRLLQLERFPNTPTRSPNLTTRASPCNEGPTLLRTPDRRDASAQGPLLYREETTTATATARPRSFYPDLIGPDASCHELVPSAAWMCCVGWPCGNSALDKSNQPARRATTNRIPPLGPPSEPSRERRDPSDRTRGVFHHGVLSALSRTT
jgi:hypothetical protein